MPEKLLYVWTCGQERYWWSLHHSPLFHPKWSQEAYCNNCCKGNAFPHMEEEIVNEVLTVADNSIKDHYNADRQYLISWLSWLILTKHSGWWGEPGNKVRLTVTVKWQLSSVNAVWVWKWSWWRLIHLSNPGAVQHFSICTSCSVITEKDLKIEYWEMIS